MCQSPEGPMIESIPPAPPLPSNELEDAMSPISLSTKSSKKSRKKSPKIVSSKSISSMISGSTKKKKKVEKRRSKSPKPDEDDPFLPRRLSDSSMKKKKAEMRRNKSPKRSNDDPFLPKRIGKSKSLHETLDKPSSSSSLTHKIKRIGRNDSSSFRSHRSISRSDDSDSIHSHGSSRSKSPIRRSDSGSIRSNRSLQSPGVMSRSFRKNGGSLLKNRSIISPTLARTDSGGIVRGHRNMHSPVLSSRKTRRSSNKSSSSSLWGSNRSIQSNHSFTSPTGSLGNYSRRTMNSWGSSSKTKTNKKFRLPSSDNKVKPNHKSPEAKKKAQETKAIMDSLVASLLPPEIATVTTTPLAGTGSDIFASENSSSSTVGFESNVNCQTVDYSTEYESPNLIWWSKLEIMELRKRELAANRKSRGKSNLDVEGMFTIQERSLRNSRILQAKEAVLDMQMVNKKEKELEAAMGSFRGGFEFQDLEVDHDEILAAEYLQAAAPALEAAVLRATHLHVHVQQLWEETECESTVGEDQTPAGGKGAMPPIPKRKTSNRTKGSTTTKALESSSTASNHHYAMIRAQ